MKLKGKALITGGSGFLGRAIMMEAQMYDWDCEFVIFSRDEQKQDVIKRRFKDRARLVLGDIRDTERLTLAMSGMDYVIHAGALKYIPEAEFNASECIAVNVGGSASVIHAARKAQVPIAVAVSTDKAVMPLNVYGATKMLMERLFVEADLESARLDRLRFGVVRYGNVIGSTGSIIPVWQRQADAGNPIKITDWEMTRFWMSVDEAVQLVLYAIEDLIGNEHRGQIIVQRAPAMRIGAMYDAMGFQDFELIGRRPGEKMDETLISEYETSKVTHVAGPYTHFAPLGESLAVGKAYSSNSPDWWLEDTELREAIDMANRV